MKISLNVPNKTNFKGCTGRVEITNPPIDVQIDGISITKDGVANIPFSNMLPFDIYLSSFSTKTPEDELPNKITNLMSAIVGSNNIVDVTKSLIVGSNNITKYAEPNPENGIIDVGGNNNLIVGANNIVIAAAGMVNGNGNIVGDADGSGITGKRNQVNNCLVTGVKNNVQNTIRSLISGEENIVTNTGTSFISGKKNTAHNYSTVALLGEGLVAASHYQTVVGTYNDTANSAAYFVVGAGTKEVPLTVFSVSKTAITNYTDAVFNKKVTIKGALQLSSTLSTSSAVSIGTTLTATNDLVAKRAVYSPNYFKGSNGYDNALLSRSEIASQHYSKAEVNTLTKRYRHTLIISLGANIGYGGTSPDDAWNYAESYAAFTKINKTKTPLIDSTTDIYTLTAQVIAGNSGWDFNPNKSYMIEVSRTSHATRQYAGIVSLVEGSSEYGEFTITYTRKGNLYTEKANIFMNYAASGWSEIIEEV